MTTTEQRQKDAATIAAELELRVLAFMWQRPVETFRAVEEIGITREDFTDPCRAKAFANLLACGPDTPLVRRSRAIQTAMPADFKTTTDVVTIANLARPVEDLKGVLVDFAQATIRRQSAAKLANVYSNPSVRSADIADVQMQIIKEESDRMNALERFRTAVDEPQGEFSGTVPTPPELMNVPGFVNTLADYTCATSPRPNRVLAFAGALAMLSHLVGRKYTDKRRTMTNLYLVALADSGVGKDHPRKVNKALADRSETLDTVVEQAGSGEGIEDSLFEHPNMLFQMDEFDTLMNALKTPSPINERIYTYLLTFFSESATSHALRRKALSQEAKEALAANPTAAAKKTTPKIYNPSLTLLSTAIPEMFYKSLSLRAPENGLLARCLVLEAGQRGKRGEGPFDTPLPEDVVTFARQMAAMDRERPWNTKVDFVKVPDAPGVDEVVKRICDENDKLYDKAFAENDPAGKAIWNRGFEIAAKLALLYALSENIANPQITVRGFEWAWSLVKYSSQRMLAMAESHISTDRDDEDCNTILRYLNGCKGRKAMRSTVGHANHLSKKRLDAAEETLRDRGLLTVTDGPYGAVIYRANKVKGR